MCHLSGYEVFDKPDFVIVAGGNARVHVDIFLHDGPAHEIQPGRLFDFFDIFIERFGRQILVAGIAPDSFYFVGRAGIFREYSLGEIAHSVGTACRA